jgi:ribosomal protein S18 acetylase RimI-like enzyme
MAPLDDDTLAILGHLNRQEFARTMARWSGPAGRVIEQDGVLLWAAATDFPVLFNGADRLDRLVAADSVIAAADRFFGDLGRGWSISIRDDHPDDLDLRAAAEDAGLVALTSSPEMVVRSPVEARATPAGVVLRWLDEGAPVADFVHVTDLAYASLGMTPGAIREALLAPERIASPEISTVVAYLGDDPVAAAQVILSHGIAGVYCVGTLEAARGRGLGDLVTRAVTNRSFDDGARACTLQASPMGEAIYARMGYEEIYRYSGLVRGASPAT